jgi:hypothetical protein
MMSMGHFSHCTDMVVCALCLLTTVMPTRNLPTESLLLSETISGSPATTHFFYLLQNDSITPNVPLLRIILQSLLKIVLFASYTWPPNEAAVVVDLSWPCLEKHLASSIGS